MTATVEPREAVLSTGDRVLAAALPFLCVGPNLPLPGLRLEHVAVYGGAVALVTARFRQLRVSRDWLVVVGLWSALFVIAMLDLALPPMGADLVDQRSLLGGVDTLLMPPCALALCAAVLSREGVDRDRFFRVFSVSVVAVAVANAALSVVSAIVGTGPVDRLFWATGDSVAERAATLGRIGGVFNQPLEAGLYNSLALLLLVHIWRRGVINRLLAAAAAVAIVVAGCLAVSKVFVVGGLPLAALYFVVAHGTRHLPARLAVMVGGGLAGLAVVNSPWLSAWSGARFLRPLFRFSSDQGVLYLYSGGRFSEGSNYWHAFDVLLSASPWFGLGPAGVDIPYDSAWIEVLAIAGLFGIGVVVALFGVLLRNAWRQRRTELVWLFVVLLAVGASIGAPSLTANRYAGTFWLTVGVMLLGSQARPPAGRAAPR